jgi:hypothetical protein
MFFSHKKHCFFLQKISRHEKKVLIEKHRKSYLDILYVIDKKTINLVKII